MKNIICFLLCFSSAFSFADVKKPVAHSVPVNFDFQFINVSQVVNLIYGEALKVPYVLDPELLIDARSVSFRYESSKGDLKPFMKNFLDSLGFVVVEKNGIQYVSKKTDAQKALEVIDPEKEIFVYFPKFREVGYLSRLISPLFQGAFTTNKTVQAPPDARVNHEVPQGSAAASIDQTADTLIFAGSSKEVQTLKNLLPQIDVRQGEVMVKGVLYEVSAGAKDGSALSMALKLLGGKFDVSFGSGKVLDTFVKFKNNSIDVVFSALATDSRFKVVSTPSLRVRSGSTGSFTVGQDVPVLGALTYPPNGAAPIQSVEYKSSGVLFNVSPQVHGDTIDLNVGQQVSNFVLTETGVNNSPTLIKRELKTALTLSDGDVVVLGGLTEDKGADGATGLSILPDWARSKSSDKSKSEILLVLQVNKI